MPPSSKPSEPVRYLVVGCTPWTDDLYNRVLRFLPGEWDYWHGDYGPDSTPGYDLDRFGKAKYAFFLHWRWLVPPEVLTATECIGFHLGNLLYQRGGSPLQHRILEGQADAELTMFRMTPEVDWGPVYFHEPVDLDGPAEACYRRTMEAAGGLIAHFLRLPGRLRVPNDVITLKRDGKPERPPLRRRPPEASDLRHPSNVSRGLTLGDLYDRIRMVDAPGYPLAYVETAGFRYTFRRAVDYGDRIEADVTITRVRGLEPGTE